MTIEKLGGKTPDITKQNIAKLAELFPECVTEGPAGTASDRGEAVIDWDLLKQALSDHLVEGPQERYRLDWPGKRRALLSANAPIDKTLRPMREESVDFDTTRNLFIEGDNLDALKLLQETYLGKVKMIYIDPPYNTGKDFIYKDNFAQAREQYEAASGQRDEGGGRLVANPETNGRFRSDWLSMMYPRLRLARDLLSDDGFLCVSINEHEFDNLKKVLDEIFGAANYVGTIAAEMNPKGRQLDWFFATSHEYIHVFARSIMDCALDASSSELVNRDDFPNSDEVGFYRRLPLRNTNKKFNPSTRPNLYYPLYGNPESGAVTAEPSSSGQQVYPLFGDGNDAVWRWSKPKAQAQLSELECRWVNGTGGRRADIFQKDYLSEGRTKKFRTVWSAKEVGSTDTAVREMKTLGIDVFETPKPLALLERLCKFTDPDDLLLDFFAGTGTLGHAVMNVNATDGGKRRYILAQIGAEDGDDGADIASLARARLKKAGRELAAQQDVGFRAFCIDSGNFADTRVTPQQASQDALAGLISHIKADRSEEDLLFGALIWWGVDITLPIMKSELAGRAVWFVDPAAEGDQGTAVIACFARPQNGKGGIDTELADAIAALKPLRVLFRDDGFATDAIRENVASRFKQLSPDTTLRVL